MIVEEPDAVLQPRPEIDAAADDVPVAIAELRPVGGIVEVLEREAGGKVYGRVDLTHALGD